jgi:hypothetical protein
LETTRFCIFVLSFPKKMLFLRFTIKYKLNNRKKQKNKKKFQFIHIRKYEKVFTLTYFFFLSVRLSVNASVSNLINLDHSWLSQDNLFRIICPLSSRTTHRFNNLELLLVHKQDEKNRKIGFFLFIMMCSHIILQNHLSRLSF